MMGWYLDVAEVPKAWLKKLPTLDCVETKEYFHQERIAICQVTLEMVGS